MKRTRLTFEMTPAVERAMEDLRSATGRTSASDVVRDAMELYDLVVAAKAAGKALRLGDVEVVLPHLELAERVRLVLR